MLEGGSPRTRKLPRVNRSARKHFPPMIDMVFFLLSFLKIAFFFEFSRSEATAKI